MTAGFPSRTSTSSLIFVPDSFPAEVEYRAIGLSGDIALNADSRDLHSLSFDRTNIDIQTVSRQSQSILHRY